MNSSLLSKSLSEDSLECKLFLVEESLLFVQGFGYWSVLFWFVPSSPDSVGGVGVKLSGVPASPSCFVNRLPTPITTLQLKSRFVSSFHSIPQESPFLKNPPLSMQVSRYWKLKKCLSLPISFFLCHESILLQKKTKWLPFSNCFCEGCFSKYSDGGSSFVEIDSGLLLGKSLFEDLALSLSIEILVSRGSLFDGQY